MSKLVPPEKPINFKPTLKQDQCWELLQDKRFSVILFGGAGGGGKTYLGISYITIMCVQYPGVVYGIARSRLVTLKKTTLTSLLNFFKDIEFVEGKQYNFDRQLNTITFWNGSKIILIDTFPYPSDPQYDRFGSYEFTGVLLDEASETPEKAFNVLQTRIRYKHKEYGLHPILLVVTNPCNNYLKHQIYIPYEKDELPDHIGVILSKATDNHYLDESYVKNLQTLDEQTKSRMLYGSWDYDDTDASIFQMEKLNNVFYNSDFLNTSHTKYLTIDVASTGSDKSVFCIWEGLNLIDIKSYSHKTIPQLYDILINLISSYGIQISNVIIDSVGIGRGLFDLAKGSVSFIANNRPVTEIYGMIKDELYYKCAEYINNGKIKISYNGYKDEIVEELSAHQQYNFEKDGKTKVTPKDKVKSIIGRSPDYSDSIVMRMYWEVKKQGFAWH